MVNVFGDAASAADGDTHPGLRGRRGEKGDPGWSGIDEMCRWIPDLTLEQFQKNNTCCCFLLTDPAKDLKKDASGGYIAWNSRSVSKMNAVVITNPSKKMLHISKTHNALVFMKSLYAVDDAVLSPSHPSYVSKCDVLGTW